MEPVTDGSAIDVSAALGPHAEARVARAVTPAVAGLSGSRILAIAAEVRALAALGREVFNFTVGDFSPQWFRIPDELAEGICRAVSEGQTHYPPSDGLPELKAAVARLYARELGLDYGPEGVCVGSGARPPLFATWKMFVEPGDVTVSFVPAWNVGYYAQLFSSEHRFVVTSAETNFHPTAELLAPHLSEARLVLMNSPLNPTGTVIDPEVLAELVHTVVDENRRRERAGQPPLMLLFDQVYWMLTADSVRHTSPVRLVPQAAPYVVHVDAISKCFAATGLRLGWAVLPPCFQPRMKAIIGHMGAWAPRAEQVATAAFLDRPQAVASYMAGMRRAVGARLDRLYHGIRSLGEAGLPVDAIAPQGAIYLSVQFDLRPLGFETNEQARAWMLEEAGVAVVPFQAFDLTEESGWFRMSVGAVGIEQIDRAIDRLEQAVRARLR